MKKEESIPTGAVAGKKQADREPSAKSYVIYDQCSECPVYRYRDAVCNDNLSALIKEGTPPDDVLKEARQALIIEFADLSGDTGLLSANKSAARMIALRYRIEALYVAGRIPEHAEAQKLFKKYGWGNLPRAAQLKRASAKIKEYSVLIEKETERQKKRSARTPDKHFSASDFNRQMVIVSKWCGFHISDRIMLSELAGYFRAYCENLEMYDNGGNYKKRGARPAKRA